VSIVDVFCFYVVLCEVGVFGGMALSEGSRPPLHIDSTSTSMGWGFALRVITSSLIYRLNFWVWEQNFLKCLGS